MSAPRKNLNDALLQRASELIPLWLPGAVLNGLEWEAGSLAGESGHSLRINPSKGGVWRDFAEGQSGKDLISLHMAIFRKSYRETTSQLSAQLALPSRGRRGKLGHGDTPVIPVSATAPSAPIRLGSQLPFIGGTLAASYPYRSADGALLFYVVRFEEPRESGKAKKHIDPLSYFRDSGWRWKAGGTDDTPLFGLPDLAARPDAPVLIVEGEKTALAATALFPEFVCMTWLGGANRLMRADFSPLAGRRVTYWPDADRAGADTVEVLVDGLTAAGAAELRVVSVPASLPQGWDVADEAPEGIDLHRLLATAEPVDLDASRMFHRLDFEGLVERLIYNSGTEQFVDRVTGLRRTRKQIDDIFGHQKGGPMGKRLIEDGRLPRTIDFTFRPNEPVLTTAEGGLLMYNLWRSSGLTPRAGDATPFLEHVRILTTTDEEAELVLDYAAHAVQRAGHKLMWALVLVGPQGTGKSLFGEILRSLVGRHNTTMVTTVDLRSDFNDWIEAKLLIVVEEMMALGRREIMNNLKPLITQLKVPINQKHVRRYEIENCANFLMLSNHEDALFLDDDDRRFYVVISDKPAHGAAYFEHFAKWAEANLDVVLHALLERDLSRFNPNARPPMAAGKQRMIEASRPPLDGAVAQAIADRELPFQHDLIVIGNLMRALKDSGSPTAGIDFNRRRLEIALKTCGAVNLGQKSVKERGVQKKLSLWAIRDAARYAAMDSSRLVRLYFAMRDPKQKASEELPF